MAENLLYEVGPGTEVGRNEFLCFGRGEMSDTFSPDGKFIKKTITFDKSKDGDSPKEDENDLICFYAALEKKSYLFRIAFSQETAPSRIKIIINDLSGIKRYVQLESPIFKVGTPFASFAFDMPESGNFRICIAPVYENPETDPEECYIAEITDDTPDTTALELSALAADTVSCGAAGELCSSVRPGDVRRYMEIMTEYDERMAGLYSAGIKNIKPAVFAGRRLK